MAKAARRPFKIVPVKKDRCAGQWSFLALAAAVSAPGGSTAPQMALGLVAGQHGTHLPVQRRADAAQPHGNILVHGGLAAPERSRRCPHRGVVGGNVLSQLHGTLFWIGFHIPPPCVPALQWYNIRAAGADYVCGLDFLSPGAYTVGGHKNRGAVRLRSASRGVPFT